MFDNILVPLDGSPLAECVLPHVVAIANSFQAKTILAQVLVSSPNSGQFTDPFAWQMSRVEAGKYLESVLTRIRKYGVSAESAVLDGHAANTIIDFAHRQNIDLIILSSHGRSGLSIWNVSGVVLKIIQKSLLPTMLVRAYQPAISDPGSLRYQTVLVPLDLSQRAECVLPIAARLAQRSQGRLIAAHIVARPEAPRRTAPSTEDLALVEQLTESNYAEAKKYLNQIESRLSSKDLQVITHLLLRDKVASALHELVDLERADLVVMSAHGCSGETRWPYGNVVEKFINYSTIPLLVYQDFRPDELENVQAVDGAISSYKGH